MNKNILQEITDKKTLLCTDLTLNSIIELIDTPDSYSTLPIEANLFNDKQVKLHIPEGTKIINSTESIIELDCKLIFELIPEIVEPPVEPIEIILIETLTDLILPIDSFGSIPFESVVNRPISLLISSEVTVLSNDVDTITFSPNLELNITFTMQKDLELDSFLDNFISSLNTANPKIISKFECPTNNDFFLKYDEFTDIMINYKDTYKDNTDINTAIGILNTFVLIDISSMYSKNILQSYYNNYISKINLIYSTIDSWLAYFERLKKLMSKIRIADAFVAEEECQNMYDAKPLDSQAVIDELVNIYDTTGQDEYVQRKQELLFEIKID